MEMTLALDVDGVLLDPDRGGAGHWTHELTERFGITRPQLRDAFFTRSWDDVINGRIAIEPALAEALQRIDSPAGVEAVLSCWFEADHVPFAESFELADRAARAGCRVVLATNQEHRRATYLTERIGARIPLDDVLYSAAIGHQKHDPRFFEVASERLGLEDDSRGSVVFVDDAAANVEVARSANWQAVHATPDEPWRRVVEQLLGLST